MERSDCSGSKMFRVAENCSLKLIKYFFSITCYHFFLVRRLFPLHCKNHLITEVTHESNIFTYFESANLAFSSKEEKKTHFHSSKTRRKKEEEGESVALSHSFFRLIPKITILTNFQISYYTRIFHFSFFKIQALHRKP